MSYNIDQIKIILDTNIPGKTPIPLTSKMLYNPKLKPTVALEEFPFITFDQRYPQYLYRLSYNDKVEFFFNKEKFIDTMRRYTDFGKKEQPQLDKEGASQNADKNKEGASQNANTDKDTQKDLERKINQAVKKANEIRASIPEAIEREKQVIAGTPKYKEWEADYKSVVKEITDYVNDQNSVYREIFSPDKTKELKQVLSEYLNKNKQRFSEKGFDVEKFPLDKISATSRTQEMAPNRGEQQYNTNITGNILPKMFEDAISAKTEELLGPKEEDIRQKKNQEADKVISDAQKELSDNTSTTQGSSGSDSTPNYLKGITQEYRDFNGVINDNIMMMLSLLFPTSYPIPSNVNSSFNVIILDNQGFHFSLTDMVPGFLKPYVFSTQAMYSYLKIDGKTYTITQVLWLNDLYNHRDYAELVLKYDKLNRWKKRELSRLDNEIEKRRSTFKKDFSVTIQNGVEHIGSWIITQDDINKLTEAASKLPQDSYGSNKYAEIRRNVEELVANLGKFNAYIGMQNPNNNTYTTISDLAISIEKLYQKVKDSIQIPQKLGRNFTELTRQIEAIRVSEIIRNKYINNRGLILNLENEEQKVKNELETKFKEYIAFGSVIKEFVRPKKESTNKIMQQQFDTFLDDTNKFLIEKMMSPEIITTIDDRQMKDTLNTGVTVLGEGTPKYEIQVMVDVIGGEINDETRAKVNCIYQGESLGNDLDRLLGFSPNKWELDRKGRFFFDISAPEVKNALAKISEPDKKTEEEKKTEEKKTEEKPKENPEKNPQLKGGNITKPKANARTMRTFLLQSKLMRRTRKHYL